MWKYKAKTRKWPWPLLAPHTFIGQNQFFFMHVLTKDVLSLTIAREKQTLEIYSI